MPKGSDQTTYLVMALWFLGPVSPIKKSIWPGIPSVPSCIIMWVKAWKKASSPKLEKILLPWRKTMKRCGWKWGLLGWHVLWLVFLRATLNVARSSRTPALYVSQSGNRNIYRLMAISKHQMRSCSWEKRRVRWASKLQKERAKRKAMEMNSKPLCWPFCASPGKLLGSPGKLAARTGYVGSMGGTKISGISAGVRFLTYSDGRIRDLWFFNPNGLFLHNSFDVWCLLCSCWFLNKNIFFTRLPTTQNILRHVWTEGLVSQLPFTCFVQVAGLAVTRGQIRKSRQCQEFRSSPYDTACNTIV